MTILRDIAEAAAEAVWLRQPTLRRSEKIHALMVETAERALKNAYFIQQDRKRRKRASAKDET